MTDFALKREGVDQVSTSYYNFVIGMTLLWGLGLNAVMAEVVPIEPLQALPYWIFLIAYFACAFLGIYLNVSSSNPVVSFIGYNLVVVPMGLVVCLALPSVTTQAIQISAIQTGIAVILMMLGGTLFPKQARSLGPFLFFALIGLIIAQLISIFVLESSSSILSMVGVAIFSLYIAYDWAMAQQADKTIDNAIDAACSIYMDIINLFMNLLRLNSD